MSLYRASQSTWRRALGPTWLLCCALCGMSAWAADSVVISNARFAGMQEEPAPPAERAPEGWLQSRWVRLSPAGTERVAVSVRWQGRAPRGEGRLVYLCGPNVRVSRALLDGAELSVVPGRDGFYAWVVPKRERFELKLEGELDGILAVGLALKLGEASFGEVELPAGLSVNTERGAAMVLGGRVLTGAGQLSVAQPPPVLKASGPLLRAVVGLGLTVSEDAVVGQGRVAFDVLQGSVKEVAFTLDVADVVVAGPPGSRVQREGRRVVVKLPVASQGRVEVSLNWNVASPAGEGSVTVPSVVPEAFRVTTSVQLARDGELLLVPSLSGFRPSALALLPREGRDLIAGASMGSFVRSGAGGGAVQVLKYEPLAGPPVVLDGAEVTAALTAEGRALVSVRYSVRNDRAAYLELGLPAGALLQASRVGDGAATVTEADGKLRVGLLRSVEAVEGLLAFPVEVSYLLPAGALVERKALALALPVVNAPCAIVRATVYAPPRWQVDDKAEGGGRVTAFTDGEELAYGFASGQQEAVVAEQLYLDALGAWMGNDFDRAQDSLDALSAMGAKNSNIDRLQGNLMVLEAPASDAPEGEAVRRVKDQALARSRGEAEDQKRLLDVAEQAERAGDYAAAEAAYSSAQAVTDKLAKLEQKESVEYSSGSAAISKKRASVKSKASQGLALSGAGEGGGGSASGAMGVDANQLVVLSADEVVIVAAEDKAPDSSWRTQEEPADLSAEAYQELASENEELYFDDFEVEGVAGGVEGGVVGGVLGGVAGGVMYGAVAAVDSEPAPPKPSRRESRDEAPKAAASKGGALGGGRSAAPPIRPSPKPSPTPAPSSGTTTAEADWVQPDGVSLDEPEPVALQEGLKSEDVSRSQVLEKEVLERIPAGRSYQTAILNMAGTSERQSRREAEEARKDAESAQAKRVVEEKQQQAMRAAASVQTQVPAAPPPPPPGAQPVSGSSSVDNAYLGSDGTTENGYLYDRNAEIVDPNEESDELGYIVRGGNPNMAGGQYNERWFPGEEDDRDYGDVEVVASRARGGERRWKREMRQEERRALPPQEEMKILRIGPNDDGRGEPEVVATSSSALVPTQGEQVLFQRNLIRADEAVVLSVRIKKRSP